MRVKDAIRELEAMNQDDEIIYEYVTREFIRDEAMELGVDITGSQIDKVMNYLDDCGSFYNDDIEYAINNLI